MLVSTLTECTVQVIPMCVVFFTQAFQLCPETTYGMICWILTLLYLALLPKEHSSGIAKCNAQISIYN